MNNALQDASQRNIALFRDHVLVILIVLFVLGTVYTADAWWYLDLKQWGIQPRTLKGLVGILTMPFLHGDFDHLASNSFALVVLGMCLLHFYPRCAFPVALNVVFWGGLLVWCFARPANHIGASGLTYGMSAFLFLSGVIRRNRVSAGPALIVALLYGGTVWGIFPIQVGVSWEGHLFGAMVGCYLSLLYRDRDLPPEPPEEPERDMENTLWIVPEEDDRALYEEPPEGRSEERTLERWQGG